MRAMSILRATIRRAESIQVANTKKSIKPRELFRKMGNIQKNPASLDLQTPTQNLNISQIQVRIKNLIPNLKSHMGQRKSDFLRFSSKTQSKVGFFGPSAIGAPLKFDYRMYIRIHYIE